jgi:hypothetical protein
MIPLNFSKESLTVSNFSFPKFKPLNFFLSELLTQYHNQAFPRQKWAKALLVINSKQDQWMLHIRCLDVGGKAHKLWIPSKPN